jgi:hypothetical protein
MFLSRLFGFLRLAAEIALVAALLGRPPSEPTAAPVARQWQPAHPRYLGTDGSYLEGFPGKWPVLLDTETGALVPCPVAGMRSVGPLGCSSWRDDGARYHLAGVGRDGAGGSYALVRRTFPGGRVLDRVKTEVMATRQPCWCPDRSDRIVFAGSDLALYVFDFPGARRSRDADPPAPREIGWQVAKPGAGDVWLRDPCWPSAPALGGRLIVALNCMEDAARRQWNSQLWWLQLSPDGDAIIGAERAIVPEAPAPSALPPQESLPSVGMTSDGTPLLAYMVESRHQGPLELWVRPIAPAAPGRGPRVLGSKGRKLAKGCAPVMPAFSADGRWVYAWRWGDRKLRPERLAVPGMGDWGSDTVN